MICIKDNKNGINDKYDKYVNSIIPKPKYFSNSLKAFLVGGLICTIGQLIQNGLMNMDFSKDEASNITTIILVFLGAFLTGIGVYDKIGKFAGAGSIVPITGFSNAIVSPAMEFKREGYILGTGAKLFSVAGPVLVYGTSTSVILGIVYYLVKYS